MPACFICKREFNTVHDYNDHVCSGPPQEPDDLDEEPSFSHIAAKLSWMLPVIGGMVIRFVNRIVPPDKTMKIVFVALTAMFFTLSFFAAIIGIIGSSGPGKRNAKARSEAYGGLGLCILVIGLVIYIFLTDKSQS